MELLERERDNLREALSWALEHGERELELRFCRALWRFWLTRGYLSEGTNWRHACGGQRKRREKLPRSFWHPVSWRCMSPTWPQPVLGWER